MTSSKPTNIDYIKTYFQILKLTQIIGEPTFATLRKLRDELKANAGSVATHLGGGLLGYLGLLFSTPEYARAAPGTPFVRPPNPGPLVIPPGTPNHAATTMKEAHEEELRVHRKCVDVEAALIKMVMEAIDAKYTKCLRNRLTQRVNMNLEVLMRTLFQRYGFVTQQELTKHQDEVRGYTYNVTDPLTTVFDLVEDLQLIAEAAGTPYTELQLVNFGLDIIRNTGDFKDGLMTWNRRAAATRIGQTL